jgi:hypothetical protein
MADALPLLDFFFIFDEAIQWQRYFLNKLSKAARASLALRGTAEAPFSAIRVIGPEGSASRATVTRGE